MATDPPHWWLDERQFAGLEHLDPEFVAGYDAKAQFDPGEDVELLRGLGLGPGTVVADIGAATGTFARACAATGADVLAVEVSPAMLQALRARTADLSNVTVVDAGWLSWEPTPASVDFVFSRNALHQLPDFWKGVALRRVADALRPGGVLRLHDLVYDAEPADVRALLDAWVAGAHHDAVTGYTAPEFVEHIQCEFGTYSWLLDELLRHSGFEVVDRSVRAGIYAAYTCRRPTD